MHQRIPLQIVLPEELDVLFEAGFRFLGTAFFRYSHKFDPVNIKDVPSSALRIRLKGFKFSKSQTKLLRKNSNIEVRLGGYTPSAEKEILFNKHFRIFSDDNNLGFSTYIHKDFATLPTVSIERCLYIDDKLVAVSICHLGAKSYNATYCFYDLAYKKYSLGTYTLLLEIQSAINAKMDYYYMGYVCPLLNENMYKMNFNNMESIDWKTMEWKHFPRQIPVQNKAEHFYD